VRVGPRAIFNQFIPIIGFTSEEGFAILSSGVVENPTDAVKQQADGAGKVFQ
jgi:hypothetical protein